MKNKLLFIAITVICCNAFSQINTTDSLNTLIKQSKKDTGRTGKVYLLNLLAQEYQSISLDTALLISQQAYKISKKINNLDGISRSANIMGNIYLDAGNYSKALEYYIEKLKIEEKRNIPEMLAIAIMNISGVYHKEGDDNKAFSYAFQADSIIDANKITRLKLFSLLNLGDMYEKADKLQPALDFTQKAYALAVKEHNDNFKGAALNNLGNIYAKKGDFNLAIQHYKESLPFLEATDDDDFIAESTLGLAKQYKLMKQDDSSFYFGMQSFNISKKNGFLSKQLDACIFLTDYYSSKNDIRNAFLFEKNVLLLKDSIYSKERIAKSQFLSMEEELRQKEIAEKKIEEAADRKAKLQYLTIGLLLPILFFITLYLSNRRIRPRFIEFLGVVSLLLTFEYIMLLLHPVIVSFSNHMPVYELLFFAIIASIITPIHHRIENWLLKILTKKERISLMKMRIE